MRAIRGFSISTLAVATSHLSVQELEFQVDFRVASATVSRQALRDFLPRSDLISATSSICRGPAQPAESWSDVVKSHRRPGWQHPSPLEICHPEILS
jgi:hypothetical protein